MKDIREVLNRHYKRTRKEVEKILADLRTNYKAKCEYWGEFVRLLISHLERKEGDPIGRSSL
jgi:hypothetical protein